ncbi:DNA gyrase inhibitor YacG [Inhella gelatinilytica]|uniref:DNA gyrase inhibitor YacG n=1 Tax=Inhella gelatinilytica TaxID=2795030 RepID=A0A931IZ30_9BURK|nr:DNA gyrase inhibitor YacG [Inhella gelatinilytica]MBH9552451.1 DNA gyrase inhibitor YacG [Inhella gelatinilytica]
MSGVREVPCPKCGQFAVFAPSNPYRPFCSARCREHDLGDWGNERFRIEVHPEPEAEGTGVMPQPPEEAI